MKKLSLNLAGSLSVLSLIGVAAASPAFAETATGVSQISQAMSSDPVAQNVTSVSQLSDVRPTDWAFTALQSLVERYGCIAGYPDSTFRGNQATSRYEFAAGLNACLDKINEIISAGLADKVSQEDLATLQKLQEEFAAELATLRGRVDALDAKTAKLEAQQFSTTTKLSGQAIMAVTGASGASSILNNGAGPGILGTPNAIPGFQDRTNVFVTSRVRLDLNTSFNGTDNLITRLEVGNGSGTVPGTVGALPGALDTASAAFGGPALGPITNTNIGFDTFGQDYAGASSTFTLAKLRYDFNVGDARVSVGPVMHPYDHIDKNSFANDEAVDFSSTFFINNPLHMLINGQTGGAGAAIDWNLGKSDFTLRALYLGGNGASPSTTATTASNITGNPVLRSNGGLFGDPYQASVELEYAPKGADGAKPFALRLLYTNGAVDNSTINAGGVNVEWAFAKNVAVFGRYGFGSIDISRNFTATGGTVPVGIPAVKGVYNPQSWMAGFSFSDVFKEGAVAGIAIGQPFIEGDVGVSSQTNLELFYSFPVTKNIRITPDIQLIFNPNNNIAQQFLNAGALGGGTNPNGTVFVGTLRTVFSF
ncbi:iron uptake porin [Pseudanabaena mucicola]|uniref:Carbohydrate porin n=1 Tax=Pseudanabaena mucicola FACHB-723 TaxID=2692860 RepID=A0ABR7ZYC7_9CYAN|nr:iron uptake porin [Pseudanabaena mucicola]MBD2188251.1 carbohydrate porin [Pseudanabaena mucicola FACHB-723]